MGETIGVQVTFSETVTVSGSPRLVLGIGKDIRHAAWDSEASAGPIVAFRYGVTLQDWDADGISIGANAVDLNGGAIRNVNGVAADVNLGPHAIAQDPGRQVLGTPPPTIQRLAVPTTPFDPRGYVVGETIGVQVTFSEAVTVSGSPRLRLGIGEDVRDASWDQESSDDTVVVFHYVVMLEDRDEDGLSIGVDALDVSDGTIRMDNGLDADVDIGDHAIVDDGDQLVLGAPPERSCTDERSLASRYSRKVVREWNGTPFRVDIIRNFPDFVTDADLQQLLDPIGWLADQIEAQLGYRIVEMGDPIDVPDGARPGWDQDFERYWRNDGNNRLLPREPGQLLAFYLNDNNDSWDGQGSTMSAHPCCGTISYNKRSLGPLWTGDDPCCPTSTHEREAIVHELFHLFGFKHVLDAPFGRGGIVMSAGALDLPWRSGSSRFYAAWTDIDNLRCIFPEGG